jgi:6-phosphogluconate dehydrogenase
MRVGIIGLGRMGMNMAKRLIGGGLEVVVFNRTRRRVTLAEKGGATGASSLAGLTDKLGVPQVAWLMLPAGSVTDEHIGRLSGLLKRGSVIVDGSNGHYRDDRRRYAALKKKGIFYLDAGVSGGIWGLRHGYCTMVGGDREAFRKVEPVFRTLAPERGYLHCGGSGAGHYLKMVHNAIEYGMMEAYAEGFELLKASPYAAGLDLRKIAALWNRGSVVRSWLLELLEQVFADKKRLEGARGYVEDSGETRWAVQEAVERGVAAEVIAASLNKRFVSRRKEVFSNRVLAVLRREFGGHAVSYGRGARGE